ncbi:MAG: tRNA(Ile)-lysidine synthase [Psychromonas sp.]|jgi:tRNA(Ile)-lysidine synthase
MSNMSIQLHLDLLPKKESLVFLACSGGVDSVVLAFLLSQLNFRVHLLHVNYHLRGEDSELDQLCVVETAKKLGLGCSVLDFDMPKFLAANKGNLQAQARQVRYDFFKKKIKENENAILMTAHHKDDQIETFFINLSRKSSVFSMEGMKEKSGILYRPLLPFSKLEIRAFATANKLVWREDISNKEQKYLRNTWRNSYLPFLKDNDRNLDENVLILIRAIRISNQIIKDKVKPLITKIETEERWSFEDFDKLNLEEKQWISLQLNWAFKDLEALINLRESAKSKFVFVKENALKIFHNDNEFVWKTQKPSNIPSLRFEKCDSLPNVFSKSVLFLDQSKIKGELKIRKWKNGDRIQSIGLKGSQLISDIIKDAKINPTDKQDVYVVEDDANIHWVVDLKISRLAVAHKETTNVLKVNIED